MSGPGLFEPGEEYVPAGIKPVVDEATLPTAPAAGGEELWLIQIPGDADPADLDGLRFRISDEGNGPEISQFKAGGESFIAFEPPSAPHRAHAAHRRTALLNNPRRPLRFLPIFR